MKEQNPLEQQRSKIDNLKKELRGKLGRFFDEKEKIEERIDRLASEIGELEKLGLTLDKEDILNGIRECLKIQDKENFLVQLERVLEPYLKLKVNHPEIFEKAQREEIIRNSGYLRLSEVLYVGFENNIAHIHLAPASELIKEKGIADLKQEVVEGLKKLAEIIISQENIEEVWAVSWIVAKTPLLFKKLGFTVLGEISEDEKRDGFENETRPVAKAFMVREDFLTKYGKKYS